LFPRECWAALERLAAIQQKTESQALVEAVALAHYVDLELAAGSQLATRRPNGKFYVLHVPWLEAAGTKAIRGDVSVPAATEVMAPVKDMGGQLAWPYAGERSRDEEDLIREMRLDELRTEQIVATIRNEQRVDAARRQREQDGTFWSRVWRGRGK